MEKFVKFVKYVQYALVLAILFFRVLPSSVAAVDCTVPISGNMTISSSCQFPGTTNGVDAGTGTTNSASITVSSGASLTIAAGQTISTGTLTPSAGSVVVVSGGAIKVGQPLWVYDADADGYPKDSTMAGSLTSEPGWRRRNLMTSMTQKDCRDFYNDSYGCTPVSGNMTDGDHSGMYQEEAGGPALGYHELPADNSTVGLWHFSSGACATDSSGNSYSFTANGGMTCATGGKFGFGASGFATTPVSYSHTTVLDTALPSGSIEAWINPANLTGTQTILYADSTNDTLLTLGSSGQINFSTSGSTNLATGNSLVSASAWTHVAAVWTSAGHKIYINGVEQASDTNTTTHTSQDYTTYVGVGSGGNTNPFSSFIDEVRISNVARTPEEIKADAQRKPYGFYTAPVDDLTQTPGSFTQLTVNAKGLKSGDGETVLNNGSLVAQWNFNATSGTTATADAGTCGAACNGTLTNFASTASQDQAAGTGWTSANRRWGAGAIMIASAATADTITVSDPVSNTLDPNSADLTISMWVKTTDTTAELFSNNANNGTACTANGYYLGIDASGYPVFYLDTNGATAGCDAQISTGITTKINDGNWHHLAVSVTRGTAARMYLDGVEIGSDNTVTSYASITVTGSIQIASNANFDGVLDTVTFYSRALTAAEILANYQAGNIEFQTRTSADNATWEAWKPTTSEAALDAVDSLSPVEKISQTSLTAYWKLDETSGTRADSKGANTLTDNNTVTYAPGRLSNAGQFTRANSEYLSIVDNTDLSTGDIDYSFSTWIYMDSKPANADIPIITKESAGNREYALYYNNGGGTDRFRLLAFNGTTGIIGDVTASNFGSPATATWYFIVVWHDATANTFNIQVNNGTANSATETGVQGDSTGAFQIGGDTVVADYFDGKIDEVAFWKRTLTAAERTQLYEDGLDLHGAGSGRVYRTRDTATKIEGAASEKLTIGSPQVDGNTVALWHMEETSGTGAYIKDATANANHGTPTGTSVVDGFYGKARSFNGTSDYVQINSLGMTSSQTIEMWFKAPATGGTSRVLFNNGTTVGSTTTHIVIGGSDSKIHISNFSTEIISSNTVTDDVWHHLAATWSGGTAKGYIDGIERASGSIARDSVTATANIGRRTDAIEYFNGSIDEVRISNIARTAEEIAEAYRAGRDHRLSKTITSTDLSAKTKLPFYLAADRPGTFLEATVGESAYANYEPDANTVGLWHLEEQTGSGAYIKDSSGNGNNGTPTGTTFVQGKLGKARNFNGTQYITVADSNSLDFPGDFTLSSWVYPTSGGSYWTVLSHGDANLASGWYFTVHNGTGRVGFGYNNTAYSTADNLVSFNQWSYITFTRTSGTLRTYVNGVFAASAIYSGDFTNGNALTIGKPSWYDGNEYKFIGSLDEVRIDKGVARTADEIRQAYEVGRRSHPVTIDFTSALETDLITGAADLSFTLSSNVKYQNSNLYAVDKVIVKENVGGTEYIAQGTVATKSGNNVTVSSWDSGSTFPTGGFTANATVFKWQREYFDLTGSLATHRDAITRLTMRVTDGSQGANVWLDDFKSNTNYINRLTCDTLTTATGSCAYVIPGSSITSTLNRYFQVRAILSTWYTAVSPLFTGSQVDYAL